jgi:hypothetical protein
MICTHRCITRFYCCGCPFWNLIFKRAKGKFEISLSNFTHFDVVLDAVNHAYLALSKAAVEPTSSILPILATSYSSASIGRWEKNPVQLPLHKASHTHCYHMPTITFVTCAVCSLEPGIYEHCNEIMNGRCVNLFYPVLPCFTLFFLPILPTCGLKLPFLTTLWFRRLSCVLDQN